MRAISEGKLAHLALSFAFVTLGPRWSLYQWSAAVLIILMSIFGTRLCLALCSLLFAPSLWQQQYENCLPWTDSYSQWPPTLTLVRSVCGTFETTRPCGFEQVKHADGQRQGFVHCASQIICNQNSTYDFAEASQIQSETFSAKTYWKSHFHGMSMQNSPVTFIGVHDVWWVSVHSLITVPGLIN